MLNVQKVCQTLWKYETVCFKLRNCANSRESKRNCAKCSESAPKPEEVLKSVQNLRKYENVC